MVKQECDDLRASLQNAEKELDDARIELTSTKKRIVSFETDSENKGISADQVDDIQKLQAQVTELQAEVEKANKKAGQQETTSERYAKDIEQKIKQIEKMRGEKDDLVEENSKLRQEVILLELN